MTDNPKPEDIAATEEYQGWVSGQAFATGHLWAFNLFQQSYTPEMARGLFDSILRSYENTANESRPLGMRGLNVQLHGLSHLEKIFEFAVEALAESYRLQGQ